MNNVIYDLKEQLAAAEETLAIAIQKEQEAGYSNETLSLDRMNAEGYVRGLQQALDTLAAAR